MAQPDYAGALIALHRFGYGARANGSGDLRSAAADPRGFVKAELARPAVALLESQTLRSIPDLFAAFNVEQDQRKAEREAQAKVLPAAQPVPPAASTGAAATPFAGPPSPVARFPGDMPGALPPSPSPATSPQAMANAMPPTGAAPAMAGTAPAAAPAKPALEQETYRLEALARFRRVAQAESGFVERLVAFWTNHFAISVAKSGLARLMIGAFEREAIRPNIFGPFAGLLRAVEQHPLMLHYLDNQQSIGPNSRSGQNGKRGLNENLAREIMELHTMGVGTGYQQTDVTHLAAILTGWTIAGRDGRNGTPGTFAFLPNNHEPGPQTLLEKVYADAGVGQGEQALEDLAHQPATAGFIATKLARHFVADAPPPALVNKLRTTFLKTNGDLAAVTNALLDADEAWHTPLSKMRSPTDYVLAATRLFGRMPEEPGAILGSLAQLGQPLWTPPGPNGFPDVASAWMSPEGMKLRLDLAAQMGQRLQNLPINPSDLLNDALGPAVSSQTRETVARAESKQQGFALLLMSPEFQRR